MTRRIPAALLAALAFALLAPSLPASAEEPGPPPGDLAGWIRRQDRQLAGGAAAGAIAEARERLAREPKSAEACYLLGRVLANTGKLDEGKAQFDAALALDANYGPAWRGMAKYHLLRKDGETAVREAQKAWDIDPTPEGRWILVNALVAKGDRAAAHRVLEEGLKKDPADNDLRYLYATLLSSEGLLRDAEREFRQVLANLPDHAPARQALIEILSNTGRRDEAVVECREAVKRAPKDPDSQFLLGKLVQFLLGEKDYSRAAALMEGILAADLPPDLRERAEKSLKAFRSALDQPQAAGSGEDPPDIDEKDLLKKLESRAVEERRGALETLLLHKLYYVPYGVVRCVWDEDETVRLYAVRLIGRNGDESLVGMLDALLFGPGKTEASPAVRVQAVRALGRIHSAASLPVLLGVITETEPEMLRAALQAFRDSPAGKSFVDDPDALVPPGEVEAVKGRVAKWWFEDPTALQWRCKAAEEIAQGGFWNLKLASRVVVWVDEERPRVRAAMLDCMALLTKDDSWRSLPTGTKEERAAAKERASAALVALLNPVKK